MPDKLATRLSKKCEEKKTWQKPLGNVRCLPREGWGSDMNTRDRTRDGERREIPRARLLPHFSLIASAFHKREREQALFRETSSPASAPPSSTSDAPGFSSTPSDQATIDPTPGLAAAVGKGRGTGHPFLRSSYAFLNRRPKERSKTLHSSATFPEPGRMR